MDFYGSSQRTLGFMKVLYGIAMTVEVPGHQPYDVRTRRVIPQRVYLRIVRGLARGDSVVFAVQADSTNLQSVRIDFSQSIT